MAVVVGKLWQISSEKLFSEVEDDYIKIKLKKKIENSVQKTREVQEEWRTTERMNNAIVCFKYSTKLNDE